MRVQAEVSLYPLRTEDLSEPINTFCQSLSQNDLTVEPGPMSTRLCGGSSEIFRALHDAFTEVASDYQVALTVKLSNACPNESSPARNEAP